MDISGYNGLWLDVSDQGCLFVVLALSAYIVVLSLRIDLVFIQATFVFLNDYRSEILESAFVFVLRYVKARVLAFKLSVRILVLKLLPETLDEYLIGALES